VGPSAGMDGRVSLAHTEIPLPDRPLSSESLHGLRCHGPSILHDRRKSGES
jgi:hypothetical protein